ncbi:oligopeptidase family protein [Cordyceps javanica]|uniref:Dipeptidyl-peptidase V n=1 Tax=Cordyceps javanica TaxID=43265 RepID=A0A545VHJ8_9HYPO|nr:oligopeptidase family protein [Cordyceps javanica]TQW12355.1 oligopeptidase family protein [Cordyceps javanica]
MVVNRRLTAESLIEIPKRSPVVPNYDGEYGLYTVSTHKIGSGTTKEVRVMHFADNQSVPLTDDANVHDARWIPHSNDILYLRSKDDGRTEVYYTKSFGKHHFKIAEFDAALTGLKLKALDDGTVVFMVAGLSDDHSMLYNEKADKKPDSGRLFKTWRVRVWNEVFREQRYSLWYNVLRQTNTRKWELPSLLHNLVLEDTIEAPYGMYMSGFAGATDNFDIAGCGVAFIGRDLAKTSPQQSENTYPYFVAIDSYTLPPAQKPHPIVVPPNLEGQATCIRLSPDGSTIGFLFSKEGGDLEDRHLYLSSTNALKSFNFFQIVSRIVPDDDYNPPTRFDFAGDAFSCIFMSEDCGRVVISHLKLGEHRKPVIIFNQGSAADYHPVLEGDWSRLLVSSSSFIDNSIWQVIDVSEQKIVRTISSYTRNGQKFGLHADMVSEIWFEGSEDTLMHCFVVRPADFDQNKKYPWILSPHGGPEGAWTDGWKQQFHAAAWAEQGYVVLLPNITGSTGFGTKFRDNVRGSWGGRPVEDLIQLIKHLETVPYLDQDKAVICGASFGAYMISCLCSHEVITKFCGAIWHDGIYSLPTWLIQTDQVVNDGSFGESTFPWIQPENLDRFNPARPDRLAKFRNAPPTLVTNGDKDYRSPTTEALSIFKTLQAQGVPSALLTFADEGHWITGRDENSLRWYRTAFDWANSCISGKIQRGDVNY